MTRYSCGTLGGLLAFESMNQAPFFLVWFLISQYPEPSFLLEGFGELKSSPRAVGFFLVEQGGKGSGTALPINSEHG